MIAEPDPEERCFLRRLDDPGLEVEITVNRYRRVDHPWGIRDRVIDQHVLYYVYQHEVVMRAGGRHELLRPQSFMWLGPGIRHSLGPPQGGDETRRVRLIHIVGRLRDRDGPLELPRGSVVAHRCSEIQAPIRAFHEQLQIPGAHAADLRRHLLAVVAAMALRGDRHGRADQDQGLDHEQRQRLVEFVARREPHAIHPRDLARLLKLSHDYFTRRFGASFGCSPRAWLHRERLERAAERLLEGGDPIGVVARGAGYPDVFPFSKQFKAHFGLSPSAFRRDHEGWNED